MKKPFYFGSAALVAVAGFPAIASEQAPEQVQQYSVEISQTDDLATDTVAELLVIDIPALSDVENGGDLSDEELDAARGGSTIVVGNQTLNAVNSGGVINGDFSAGSISLADNALTNFNGFGNLVINTGAQNNLQSGMNVTINFAN
ncbi:MAG: hypothetical protein KA312_08525 [Sphingorhabdus sp.]|nr:hypothetical protein [Sphingorhabdus sp.]